MNGRPVGTPFPNPSTAFTLAATAAFLSFLLPTVFGGGIAAAAVGSALGFGGLGYFAARMVPEPVGLRLGMAPFPVLSALEHFPQDFVRAGRDAA